MNASARDVAGQRAFAGGRGLGHHGGEVSGGQAADLIRHAFQVRVAFALERPEMGFKLVARESRERVGETALDGGPIDDGGA